MGLDPMAVADDSLRVHGIGNLRVVDASIIPTRTSGNTNAPSIMIGEECVEMVLAASEAVSRAGASGSVKAAERSPCKMALARIVQCTQQLPMNSARLHVLVLDANEIRASIIRDGLSEAGDLCITVLTDANEFVQRVTALDPDVIFIDLENPNRDLLEHMFQVSRAVRRPVAMFVDQSDTASVRAAIEAGVSAYIVDGLKKERVTPILHMAISRFKAFDRLQRELEATKTELAERKTIERAKSLLIRSRGISEPEAYALLRRTAMNQNRRIADIAEALVMAASLLTKEAPE